MGERVEHFPFDRQIYSHQSRENNLTEWGDKVNFSLRKMNGKYERVKRRDVENTEPWENKMQRKFECQKVRFSIVICHSVEAHYDNLASQVREDTGNHYG